MSPPPLRPRSAWFLLIVVPLGLAGLFVAKFAFGMVDEVRGMARVVVPGSGEVRLEAGSYVVYGETRSVVEDESYFTTSMSMRCNVVDSASGAPVPLESTTGSSSYTMGGFEGRSMFELAVPRAGAYRVTCEGDGGPATIAFGRGIGRAIFQLLGAIGGGIAGAVVIAVVIDRMRSKARKAQARAAITPGPA